MLAGSFFALFLSVARGESEAQRASASFMMISGITGPDQCLAAVGESTAMLEPCTEAIAAGDGREVWAFEGGGKVRNVVNGKCLAASSGAVSLGDCSAKASAWELTAEGQLRLQSGGGDLCLTQSGSFAGDEDVAHGAPVHATSSSEESSHGAVKAVDGNEKTYWTSALDAEGQQVITVDFGDSRTLVSAVVEWELPAMAYSVQLSSDGASWTDAFATDVNGLFTNRVYLGYASASKLRLVMTKPHPVYAQFQGKKAYGIRRIAVISPRLHTAVEKCDVASKSADARDKVFLSYVGNFDPCPSKALRAEVPALESAITSLASASSKLADKFPQLGSCGAHSFLESKGAKLRGAGFALSLAEVEAAAGTASGLVKRMTGIPDADGAVDAARDVMERVSTGK